jgi:hypothetical protein
MPQSAQQRRAIEGRGAAILPDTWGLEMNDAILAALLLDFAGATSLNSMLSGIVVALRSRIGYFGSR